MALVEKVPELVPDRVASPAWAARCIHQDRNLVLIPVGQETPLERCEALLTDLLDVERKGDVVSRHRASQIRQLSMYRPGKPDRIGAGRLDRDPVEANRHGAPADA